MDLSEYYSKSFESFKRNPKIMVPQLVGTILTYLIGGIFVSALLFWFFGSDFSNILSTILTTGTMPTDVNLPELNTSLLFIFIVLSIIIALVIAFIDAFVSAATIGMGNKIIKEGSSNLGFAWKCGRKYFLKIFLLSVVIGLIFLVLLIPIILGFISPVLAVIGFIISFILGILLFLSMMVAEQSIVIGEKGVIEAIRESFDLWNNKLTVFLVAVINVVISLVLGLVLGFTLGFIPVVGSSLSNIIISLLLTPFFALVTIYLYLNLKVEDTVLETQ